MSNATFSNLTRSAEAASKEITKFILSVVDENSFVETDKFISESTELGEAVGEGVVCGFAHIFDTRVALFATNSSVLKGSIGKANAQKIVKTIRSACQADIPLIGILDTYGARVEDGIDAMEGYAAILYELSYAQSVIPVILTVKGADYGLSSYLCPSADLCIAYDKAQIATSSPLILAGDTKLDPSAICTGTYLGEHSDVVTNVVKDEKQLKEVINKFLRIVKPGFEESEDDPNRTFKKGAVKNPFDAAKEIFDRGSILELRENFAPEVKTGLALMGGISVGYVAVCGKLTASGANKINKLLNLCDAYKIAVINLVDCDGVKTCAECDGKTIRAVGDMISSYSLMPSPVISVVCNRAIGLGYAAFAAKGAVKYSVAWCDAKIGIAADETAARMMFAQEIALSKDSDKTAAKLAACYGEENTVAPVVAKKGYLDNVIEPALTRPYIISALQIFAKE